MESPSMLAPTTSAVGSATATPFLQRHYILLKAHYFLFFSAFGVLYPVLSITLRSRGLSDTEISYINLIIPFLVFFSNPLIGFLADHSRRHLLTFNILAASTIVLYSLMFTLPSIRTHHIQAKMTREPTLGRVLDFCASQEVATQCSSRSACGCSYTAHCRKDDVTFNFTFAMNADNALTSVAQSVGTDEPSVCGILYRVPIDAFVANYNSSLLTSWNESTSLPTCEITCSTAYYCHGSRYPQQTLYLLLYSLLFILGTNLLSNAITIGASIGFASLAHPDLFGKQRVWGTIGFGVSAWGASLLYGVFKTEFVYLILYAITAGACICVTFFIRIHSQKQKRSTASDETGVSEEIVLDQPLKDATTDKKKKSASQAGLPALIPLLKRIDVVVFLSLAFIWGMSYAGLDPYVYLYIDAIAPCASRTIIGRMSVISASSEILALFIAGRMLKLFGANVNSVIILIAFAIRFAGYYAIRQPHFFLFMETMHYFNFGILYILIAQKADAIAPPGLAGTLQGVVYGLSFGLGRGFGLIVSSFIYTRMQSRTLFLFFACFNVSAAVVYSLIFLVLKKRSQPALRSNTTPNVPKIVIDPDTSVHEDPLLIPAVTVKTDSRTHEQ